MDRLLAGAVCCVALIGCAQGSREMDEADIQDLGERYTAAWNAMDPDAVAAFHAGSSFLRVNDGDPARGLEAIADVARGFMTAFPDLLLEMDSMRVEGEAVEYHWTFSGTNSGPGGTGNRVRFSGYEVWTIGPDGLITSSLGHFDQAEYDRQLEVGVDRRE